MDLVVRLPGRPSIRGWRRAIVAAAVSGLLACLSMWPLLRSDPYSMVLDALVAVSFMTTGVVLAEEPTQRGNARALVLCGLLWLVSWWNIWDVGPFPLLSTCVGYLWVVFGCLALLRYPGHRLARSVERAFLIGLGIWVCGMQLVVAVVSRPEWHSFSAAAWWPTLFPDRELADALDSVFYSVTGVAAVAVLVLLMAKLWRVRGMDRLDSVPVTVAAGATAVGGGLYMVTSVLGLPQEAATEILRVVGLTALVTPLAFLTVVLQRRLVRSSVADLVLGLGVGGPPSVDHIQAALRDALRDDSLRLWLWLPTGGRYVDAEGTMSEDPVCPDRLHVPVRGRQDEPLAVLHLDPALERHTQLVESAVVASGLALENGRLHADLEQQLTEVRASRARIVEATREERQRIERDLHDGAQQTLLTALATLSLARMQGNGTADGLNAIDDASSCVKSALEHLRSLARGIHPTVLTQGGLGPAVEDVAEGLPLAVHLEIPERRWRPAVEVAAYFMICEALSNAVKHAGASSALVRVEAEESYVAVEVSDDGVGGATLPADGGLAGVVDRIDAVGGSVVLRSPVDGGTTVTARIPCE